MVTLLTGIRGSQEPSTARSDNCSTRLPGCESTVLSGHFPHEPCVTNYGRRAHPSCTTVPTEPMPPQDHEEADEEESRGLLPPSPAVSRPTLILYGACCALLAVQNSSYTLIRRYGQGVLKEEASSQSILAVGEMLKGAFCLYMVLRDLRRARTSGKHDEEVDAEEPAALSSVSSVSKRLALTSAPMAVPALIFLAMNLLSFVSLRRISASAFTLIQQSKLIFTAVLSRVLLGKTLSSVRWRALGTLLCAVLIICYETRPDLAAKCVSVPPAGARSGATLHGAAAAAATPQRQLSANEEEIDEVDVARRAADYAVGVAAVALEAALSGFSNVYFERVLKSTSVSLWERNVQLAGYSLLIYVPMALSVDANLLHGWSVLTWLTAFLGALGGILIGLVINYMDSISKNLALTVAIVIRSSDPP